MNPYQVLGVADGSALDVVQAAYRKLARQYHPDVNKSPLAVSKMQEVNAAWDMLKTSEKKAEVDRRHGYGQSGSNYGTPKTPRPQDQWQDNPFANRRAQQWQQFHNAFDFGGLGGNPFAYDYTDGLGGAFEALQREIRKQELRQQIKQTEELLMRLRGELASL